MIWSISLISWGSFFFFFFLTESQMLRVEKVPVIPQLIFLEGPGMGTLSYSFWNPCFLKSWKNQRTETWNSEKITRNPFAQAFLHLYTHPSVPSTPLKKKISVGFGVS